MILFPIIIVVLIAGWFYRKTMPELATWQKNLLWILRSMTLIIILLLLFNPVISFSSEKKLPPRIVFLNDDSASMQQTGKEESKLEILQEISTNLKSDLQQKGYDVVSMNFADGLEGDGTATYLSKTIIELQKQDNMENLKQIFLFSDGWLQDENLDFLQQFTLPINTIEIDFEYTQSDLMINSMDFPKSTYKDDLTPFSLFLSARNFKDQARIDLIANDVRVQTKTVDFYKKDQINLEFEHAFHTAGLQKLKVKITADSLLEINTANNELVSAIQVLENRRKCLIISDQLIWDVRFIKNTLKSLPRWEVEYLQKNTDLKKANRTTQLQNEISNTNTLILINNKNLRFSGKEQDLIENFVNAGGGLMLMGKEIKSLSKMLPATDLNIRQSFSGALQLTESSSKYQTFRNLNTNALNDIPPVNYYYTKPRLQAEILAEINNEQNSPAILFANYSEGKIMQFAFTGLWKWQLRSATDNYQNFINDLIIWLGTEKSELFYAYTAKTSYSSNEKIRVNLSAFDETMQPRRDVNARIKLYRKDEDNKLVEEKYLLSNNNQYAVDFEQLEPGDYNYQITDELTTNSTSGEFTVQESNSESRDFGFNSNLLSYIAEQTDGKYFSNSSWKNIDLPNAETKEIDLINDIPIYRKWYVIALFLVCFCLELYLRKRWGLL